MPKAKSKHTKKPSKNRAARLKPAVAKQPSKIANPEPLGLTEASRPSKKFKLFIRRQQVSVEEKAAIIAGRAPLTPARKLLVESCKLLLEQRKILGGILLVYLVIDLILIGGASGSGLQSAKNSLTLAAHGHPSHLATGITLFAFLINANGSASSAAAGAYQTILLLITAIVFIWALRQVYAGHKVSIREAFYTGTYPIVPFLLVMICLGVQLIPMTIGGLLYNMLVGGGVALGPLQIGLVFIVTTLLSFWSLYMITASLFALIIVTLPGVTPLEALSAAREHIRFRRLQVLGRIVFLLAVLAIGGAVILIPTALFLTSITTWLFLLLSVAGIGIVLSYLYRLYRELI